MKFVMEQRILLHTCAKRRRMVYPEQGQEKKKRNRGENLGAEKEKMRKRGNEKKKLPKKCVLEEKDDIKWEIDN